MKKLYSALGILLVITGFCWFTAWRVDDLCNTSASLLLSLIHISEPTRP